MSDSHPHDTPPVPVAWRPDVFGVPMLQRDSPFSYACHACKRCCQHYRIKANPYEVLRLARHLGLTTTAFIDAHLVDDAYLPHDEEGHCRFLGEQGCTVHPARPLVCRVYPLGLHVDGQGVERFSHLQPHPRTEGEYGTTGTVDDYLRQQGAAPFIAADERYLAVLLRLAALLQSRPDLADAPTEALLDADQMIDRYHPHANSSQRGDPEQAMALHLAAIEQWISTHTPHQEAP